MICSLVPGTNTCLPEIEITLAGAMEVYSWGNGANYQLGTGTAGIHRIPCRIDALQSLDVTSVAAAKFTVLQLLPVVQFTLGVLGVVVALAILILISTG
jgi:hypothetical protein